MFDDDRWYPRLADMPGLKFTGSPGIDRSRLRGHDTRPRPRSYGTGWEWPEHDDQWTSPATAHGFQDWADKSSDQIARNVWECLELPGTLSDWHFTLQGAESELWRRRYSEPSALQVCEQFCLVTLDFASARPEAFQVEAGQPDKGYLAVHAFGLLVQMYRAMDDLPAAVLVARRAEGWGNQVLGKAADELQALLDAGL